MARVLVFSLIALLLLAVSTVGARADAEAAWRTHPGGRYAAMLKALDPATTAGGAWRPGGAPKLDAR